MPQILSCKQTVANSVYVLTVHGIIIISS